MRNVTRRTASGSNRAPLVAGQFIVRFKPQAVEAMRAGPRLTAATPKALKAARAATPNEIAEPLAYLRTQAGLRSIQPMFRRPSKSPGIKASPRSFAKAHTSLVESADNTWRESLRGFQLVEVDPSSDPDKIVKALSASKAIEFVEPVPDRWLCASASDPFVNRQWGLRAIRWFSDATHPSAATVHVAVLDSGIDAGHPDLKHAIEVYEHGAKSSSDILGHGTHVSGTIAAAINNGVGISGIANCRLHCVKIFADPPAGSTDPAEDADFDFDAFSNALAASLDSEIKVVNMSIGGGASSQTEAILFEQLADAGVVCVAAMGNEFAKGNPIEFPAAYKGVMAVGAIDEADRRASFSNTGTHIAVVAPGVNVLSTVPRKKAVLADATDYDSWPGTSMATPHVAGCAALLYAGKPKSKTNARDIVDRLKSTARRLPGMGNKKKTQEYGFGLVDLAAALK
jgi:subtilisin family serine protease